MVQAGSGKKIFSLMLGICCTGILLLSGCKEPSPSSSSGDVFTPPFESIHKLLEGIDIYQSEAGKVPYVLEKPAPSDILMTLLAKGTLERGCGYFAFVNRQSDYRKGRTLSVRSKDGKTDYYMMKIFKKRPEHASIAVFDAQEILKKYELK